MTQQDRTTSRGRRSGDRTGNRRTRRSFPLDIKRVIDGDGFEALIFGTPGAEGPFEDIRLFGIDAPELAQPYGEEATEYLSSLVKDGRFYMEIVSEDAHGRQVAIVYRNSFEIEDTLNYAMVAAGWAYWYEDFDPTNSLGLREAQGNAFFKELGVWQDGGNEERPWDFKDRKRQEAEERAPQGADALAPRVAEERVQQEADALARLAAEERGTELEARQEVLKYQPVVYPAPEVTTSEEASFAKWKSEIENDYRAPGSHPFLGVVLLGEPKTFELIVEKFLETYIHYREDLVRIWRWKRWPGRKGLDINGVDFVAEDSQGHTVAIKCEYSLVPTIRLSGLDLTLFLRSLSTPHFQRAIVCSTTGGLNESAKERLADTGKPFEHVGFQQFEDSSIDWRHWRSGLRRGGLPLKPSGVIANRV